jgi:hypothetical protein
MTLCITWIRETPEGEEMVFATDSCLGMGERWESGVKLFELPRKDCLICFSGYTFRTYPLILNLINSLKYDKYVLNQKHDITYLIDYITSLFTDLIRGIKLLGKKDYEDVLKEDPPFDFLFGGWSWKESKLKLWKIYYSYEAHGFVFTTDYNKLVFSMIGTELDEARKSLEDEINRNNKVLAGSLDMEPLKVLVEIIREPKFDDISGAVQLAKLYPPGVTEFFGVYYPSIVNGRRTFLGRDVSKTNNPSVRFIDPDTGFITELDVPNSIDGLDTSIFGVDETFVAACYPGGFVKDGLGEKDRELIQKIFKGHAYKLFMANLAKIQSSGAEPVDE